MTIGRPTAYRPDHAELARKLCRNGATDREIADLLGICVRTFYRWRAEHDDFAEALATGKHHADERIERSLYQRACGYDYEDVRIFHPARAEEPVIVPVTVYVPADVGAARQWLACRRPQLWGSQGQPEENSDLGDRLARALERVKAHDEEKEAADAERFARAVEAGIADALARRGLQP